MRLLRPRTATVVACLLALAFVGSAPAYAGTAHRKLAPRTHFTMAPDGSSGTTQGGEGIPNIDSVKSTVRTYYGATDPAHPGIANKTRSPYIGEMRSIVRAQWRYLDRLERHARRYHQKPAIVFDADDTTLWTYDMEDAAMHFNFDVALQDEWVQDQKFPATPSMVGFVNQARKRGFKVFGLTGRSDDQKAATIANLHKVGYQAFDDSTFFTKWTGVGSSQQPSYITCATAKCTTVEYKAGTRKHIEKLGYDIVLNVGDQWSDLQGGYADKVLKLPNPTYYLPSPNLPGVDQPRLSPRTRFTMKADGSSGSRRDGEGIPNIDSVKSTIRTYYGATDPARPGIANKTASPYISEVTALAARKTEKLTQACATAKAHGRKPAIAFDADDTTLWTYDMEDGAMHFNFSPTVQDKEWVQPERFPATPGMVDLVNKVGDAGCTIVGLTGRSDDQKQATLGNLAKVGYDGFTSALYFTKWTGVGASQQPSYITCAAAKCTTIEYKSQTRKHVADDLHYDIVANLGDQFSDLIGGHADRQVKLPNPTYYLP